MPVIINWKICDNAKECGGIEVCPTKALYWNEKKKTIVIDNSKCINCGLCEPECPVGAIRVAKTEEEYKKIKKEIDKDFRKISDLFVDRYGASPVTSTFVISEDKLDSMIRESKKLVVVEIFGQESIECLLYSIPIKDLFKGLDLKYGKMKVKEKDPMLKKYKIKKLPALLFFRDNKILGKIEGYFDIGRKKEMKKKANNILKSRAGTS